MMPPGSSPSCAAYGHGTAPPADRHRHRVRQVVEVLSATNPVRERVTTAALASSAERSSAERSRVPLHAPLIVCGIAFGGFVDGIAFHQILTLHHMLSNARPCRAPRRER